MEQNYYFEYIQLVRKSDMKEVYSSPAYTDHDSDNVYDFPRIGKALNYYFERVNSGIQQQLDSPKTTDEVKATLKFLDKKDYLIRSTVCMPIGINKIVINWSKDADVLSKWLKV